MHKPFSAADYRALDGIVHIYGIDTTGLCMLIAAKLAGARHATIVSSAHSASTSTRSAKLDSGRDQSQAMSGLCVNHLCKLTCTAFTASQVNEADLANLLPWLTSVLQLP